MKIRPMNPQGCDSLKNWIFELLNNNRGRPDLQITLVVIRLKIGSLNY